MGLFAQIAPIKASFVVIRPAALPVGQPKTSGSIPFRSVSFDCPIIIKKWPFTKL